MALGAAHRAGRHRRPVAGALRRAERRAVDCIEQAIRDAEAAEMRRNMRAAISAPCQADDDHRDHAGNLRTGSERGKVIS
jgi:hypothetical protein